MRQRERLIRLSSSDFVKKTQVKILVGIIADTCGAEKPSLHRLDYEESLETFARYSDEQARKSLLASPQECGRRKQRLFNGAYTWGNRIRRILGLKQDRNVGDVVSVLYRTIGIDLSGSIPGSLTVSRCFFSDRYSPEVCSFISALDEGIIAGLSGGGTLTFTSRITEGDDCCRACFTSDSEDRKGGRV